MPVRITPAIIINVSCDKCGVEAPDVATTLPGIEMVKRNMEADGWTFCASILKPESPPNATCPDCAKTMIVTSKPQKPNRLTVTA